VDAAADPSFSVHLSSSSGQQPCRFSRRLLFVNLLQYDHRSESIASREIRMAYYTLNTIGTFLSQPFFLLLLEPKKREVRPPERKLKAPTLLE